MRACRWLAVGLVVAVLAVGCSGKPSSGAIQVKVNLLPGLKSTCVRVEVYPSGGVTPEESGPILIAGKTQLTVGVVPTGQAEPVTVQAVGYSDADCNSRTTPAEVSDMVSGRFATPVTVLEITLGPPSGDGGTDAGMGGGLDGGSDAGVDGDGDGFLVPEDCDDTDPLIKPGAQELCRDRLDNDCDQLIDCADSSCDLQVCAVTMNGGATCGSGLCLEIACGDQEDNDGDGLPDCRDLADCTGQTCGASGTCDAADGGRCVALNEMSLCNDGEDNDTDTFVDCADSDCPVGSVCSDFDPCTDMDTCNGSGACVPAGPVTCMSPPNTACYEMMGTCLPDAGGSCDYRLNQGMSCSDGRVCTKGDSCDADGGCAGSPTCDTPPGACYGALGTCNEADGGGCDYAPLPPGPCDDRNNCTANDSCDGDGGCAGSPVACTPDQCQQQAGCTDAGTCLFSVKVGGACDAGPGPLGSCNAAGACVPKPANVFPFTPSNFTEAQLPATAGALTFDCGTTTVDTGAPGASSLTWTNNCTGNPGAPAFTEVTIGSAGAVLLFADSLTVASGATLRAVGSRALILAVRNDATVNGTIDVGSTNVAGAGANQDCVGAAGTNGGDGTGSGSNTAGGGGGGAFGSNGGAGAVGEGATAGAAGAAITGTGRLVPLRGGCNGGNGGRVSSQNGIGGNGGGAVQLTVAGTLLVSSTGRVTAYGRGGQGGLNTGGSNSGTRGGGGGAGSGGGILLEAATLSLNSMGAITANGGSGAQAAGGSTGADGRSGNVASSAIVTGATSGTCGGDGGDGAAGSTNATGGAPGNCYNGDSGGGGGGGVGRIFLRGSTSCTLSGVISPPARGSGANGCPPVP